MSDEVQAARVMAALMDDPLHLRHLIEEHLGRNKFSWLIRDAWAMDRRGCLKLFGKEFLSDLSLCPVLDDAWEEHLETKHYLQSDSWSQVTEDWIPYRHKRQWDKDSDIFVHDDFKFYFELEWDRHGDFIKLKKLHGYAPEDIMDEENDEIEVDTLRALYVLLVRLDEVFDNNDLQKAYSWELLAAREQWEEGLNDDEREEARLAA
jgi:hypothetical protein